MQTFSECAGRCLTMCTISTDKTNDHGANPQVEGQQASIIAPCLLTCLHAQLVPNRHGPCAGLQVWHGNTHQQDTQPGSCDQGPRLNLIRMLAGVRPPLHMPHGFGIQWVRISSEATRIYTRKYYNCTGQKLTRSHQNYTTNPKPKLH